MGRASGLERHVCGHPCGRRGERTPIAPEILIALWLYATLEGVGSARAVARLTWEHDAYRWICGGVQVNDHTLADLRTAHGAALDAVLTDSVAALLAVGAVTLQRVAQDGIRIRASGKSALSKRSSACRSWPKSRRNRARKRRRRGRPRFLAGAATGSADATAAALGAGFSRASIAVESRAMCPTIGAPNGARINASWTRVLGQGDVELIPALQGFAQNRGQLHVGKTNFD
ncbi:MAG: transposase [Chromatiaceae bacterium]|nr:transposase [Chromatiaceae bacterium]